MESRSSPLSPGEDNPEEKKTGWREQYCVILKQLFNTIAFFTSQPACPLLDSYSGPDGFYMTANKGLCSA